MSLAAWIWAGLALAGSTTGTFTDASGRSGRWTADGQAALSTSPGLLLFFHEDGGERRYGRYARRRYARLARSHDLRVVSLQEPGLGYWWAPSAGANSTYVAEFLAWWVTEQPFDEGRVVFAGKSGGASFASGLPAHLGYAYSGGVVALCGADIPRLDGDNDEDDPPARPPEPAPAEAEQRLYFAITGDDELRGLSELAAAHYREQGLSDVVHLLLPGSGHCDFNTREELARGLLYVLPPAPLE